VTHSSNELFIGLMSGTSIDGIDAVLIDFSDNGLRLIARHTEPFPPLLRYRLRQLAAKGSIDALGRLDAQLGELFASAVLNLLDTSGVSAKRVTAIGSHGQTIRHRPDETPAFTLQIGDPNRIAARTGITTVADFRRRDIAVGGEGAPLVPAFHAWFFQHDKEDRVILNIGGIANITILPARSPKRIVGFDTGPGNTLLDLWSRRHLKKAYDAAGDWGASGAADERLLQKMLEDPYFSLKPPKSTGPEHFNLAWLETALERLDPPPSPADIQATLTRLTAATISDAIKRHAPAKSKVLVCGGGVHNQRILALLGDSLPDSVVESTARFGLDPDWVEAAAFAWLARQALCARPGNIPQVTGAKEQVVLGGLYPGRKGWEI